MRPHGGILSDPISPEFLSPSHSLQIRSRFYCNFAGIEWSSQEYLNSLLEVLEANLTFVPSSTAKGEVADISLFDHLKLTGAYPHATYKDI